MKIYFNNLNGIRFLLAFMVIILHTAAIKQHNGLPNYLSDAPYLYVAGEIAVSLFFTLSGFLITYYLLIEKQKTNTIQLRLFYFKRILRIWPLYFLAIILYWLIIPNLSMGTMLNDLPAQMTGRFVIFDENISWATAFTSYLFFIPQIAVICSGLSNSTLYPAPHLWSIGVEELFYMTIPLVLWKARKTVKTLSTLTVGYYFLPVVFLLLLKISNYKVFVFVLMFISVNSFCCMLLGSLSAYLYIHHSQKIIGYCNKYVAFTACAVFVFMIAKSIFFYWFVRELYCFLFCIIMIYAIENKTVLLENKVISYLGKISYGIYIYHNFAIAIIIYQIKKWSLDTSSLSTRIAVTLTITALTILIATLSYEFFEKRFLKLKSETHATQ
jgi:peptidoglycan/LPS O-acetylase OafA/YrhL